MKYHQLQTPAFLVDLDILNKNISSYQKEAIANGKKLWPMTKTHKSSQIAQMQLDEGAEGLLVGTIAEAEVFAEKTNVKKIMLAYPIFGKSNLMRVERLFDSVDIIFSIDSYESAKELSDYFENSYISYLVIYNSGLNRFGVEPETLGEFVNSLKDFSNLNFKGIATHTGQVYGATSHQDVKDISVIEVEKTEAAVKSLNDVEISAKYIATGTTPTYKYVMNSGSMNSLRPGNYVFHDAIQVGLEVCEESECSLSVLARIVSNPQSDLFILDVGSKCLGLDQGAHGTSLVKGFGRVIGHPELEITGLSEEVSKVKISGETNLKVGDTIRIIPNHSCSASNMTNFLVGIKGDDVIEVIEVDARGNSIRPVLL